MPYRNPFSILARRSVSTLALHSTIEWKSLLPLSSALLLLLICAVARPALAAAQITLLSPSAKPAVIDSGDTNPTEVGMKFKSDTSGYITGLRFYKAAANTGTHVAHIWDKNGIYIGRAVFTNETASGWQQVNFAKPVPIAANTVYIAAYFAPSGHYSETANYFATAGINNGTLHALQNGADGPNGVYRHSINSGFPGNSNASSNYWVDIVYSSEATAANPKLTVSATSLSFGSVAVNSAATSSVTLTSSGTSPVTVNSAAITGTGFSIEASTFPVTLSPNQSLTLQLQFKPTSAASDTGKLTISSNSASGGTATVSLSGTGAAANPKLAVSASTLSFGSVAVNSAATGSVTLTSTGSTAVTVSSASVSGTGFSIVGGTFPATLNPNQTMALQLQFKPSASGSDTGQLTINSNSTTGTSAVVALSGTATATAHQVDLTWNAPSSSADPVAGYHVYRATSGGPTQLLTSSLDAQTSYADSTVVSGTTYDYTVKSVDSSGAESAASNEIAVSVP